VKKQPGQSHVVGVLGDTRGRLLSELCAQPRTAAELAAVVNTSANAVRVHLDGLSAAGLVVYRVERRGVGKPTHVYSLTAAAEYLLSVAYAPALKAILDRLRMHLNGGLRPMLREAGVALAESVLAESRQKPSVAAAVGVLRDLGAPAEVEKNNGRQTIRGACCPLGAATRTHPELCGFIEGALTFAGGVAMTERCQHGEHPRCAFVIGEPQPNLTSEDFALFV
jgi:DeoR family transcriptional regulator, suf operon transcriptional repressor